MPIPGCIEEYKERCNTFICKYFRGVITAWRVASGWFGLIGKLSIAASMVLTELSTKQRYTVEETSRLALYAIVLQGVCFFCQSCRDYARDATQEHKQILGEIQEEFNLDHRKVLNEIKEGVEKNIQALNEVKQSAHIDIV